jgi:ubiquinone/menaquinone biosynthesis C-methylase UbiE
MSSGTSPGDVGPGGYDASYRQCACFWGRAPGRLVAWLIDHFELTGKEVLDLGCGEGKNAARLAKVGCHVEAWDISDAGLGNAKRAWPNAEVRWILRDAMTITEETREFHIVIAYGLLHCLAHDSIQRMIRQMKRLTAPDGFNLVVAFNDRLSDIRLAHPGFEPSLLPHLFYKKAYQTWELLYCTDEDLRERHPTNNIDHTHSMTRIIARKRGDG